MYVNFRRYCQNIFQSGFYQIVLLPTLVPFCFFHCNHSGEYVCFVILIYFISLITNEIEHWLPYFVKYLFTSLAHMSKFFLCCGSVSHVFSITFVTLYCFSTLKGLFWTLLFNFVLSIWNWLFSFFFYGGREVTLVLFEIKIT